MRHKPTNIEVRVDGRSQLLNRRTARELLEIRVTAHFAAIDNASRANNRKYAIGSGERGDKIRTYREQDNLVICHRTDQKYRLSDAKKGLLKM
jgi:peptide chain release factor 1